jgi:type IV pilus assembly protein PilM
MFNSNNSFIGLDIGASAIKLVVLKSANGVLRLKEAFVSEFEFDETTLKAKHTEKAIAELVKSNLKKASIGTKKVCVSIWGQSAFIRFIKLPKVERKKLIKMIGFEAQQQVPFPLDDVIWDYQIFSNSTGPEFNILLVAVKNKVIKFLLEGLKETGLEIEFIDTNPLACLNAVNYFYKDANLIIVDIGAKSTNLMIKEGQKIWTRSIALGGNDITKSIMVHYNIDFKKAEELKKKGAKALLPDAGKEIDDEDASSKELSDAISPILTTIASELSNSIGFYKSQFSMSKDIKKVLLTGGSSCIVNLDKFFEYNLGIQVELIDIAKDVKFLAGKSNPTEISISGIYTSAIGLALRGFKNASRININLLPREEKVLLSFKHKAPVAIVLLTALLLAFSTSGYMFFSLNRARSLTLKELTNQGEQLSSYGIQINQLNSDLAVLKARVSKLNDIKLNRYFWPNILAEIARVLPRELWLTDVRRESSAIIIDGKSEGSFVLISDFKDKLEQSKLFKNVEIISANLEKKGAKQESEQGIRVFTMKMVLE